MSMRMRINFFILGVLGAAVVSAITIPFLAWFYPVELLGKFSFFLLTASFAVQVGTLGLEQAYVREYRQSKSRGELLVKVLGPSVVFLCLIIGFAVTFDLAPLLSAVVAGESYASLGYLILLGYVASIAQRFLTVFLRVWSAGLLFFVVLVLAKLLFILAAFVAREQVSESGFLLYFGYAVSIFIPVLVVTGYLLYKERAGSFPAVNLSVLVDPGLLRYAIPLSLGAVAFWGVKFSGHLGLRLDADFEGLAYYSVGISIATGVGVLGSLFNTMWFPFLFKLENEGGASKAMSFGLDLAAGILLLGVGLLGVLSDLVVMILPPAFEHIKYMLPVLVMSPFLYTLSEVTGSGIALSRKTSYGMLAGVIASLSAVGSAVLLVREFGAFGAAYAYLLGHIIFFVLRTEFSRRLVPHAGLAKCYPVVLVCLIYVVFFSQSLALSDFTRSVTGLLLVVISAFKLRYAAMGYRLLKSYY